jgi:iron complex outermembrane recepter protein
MPKPEKADTTTVGIVWTPNFGGRLKNEIFSLDWYDINIKDYIGNFGAQEILDACYNTANAAQCAKIVRVGGTLTLPGSGIQEFTTNLKYIRAKGIELGFSVGLDIGAAGSLTFAGNANEYLTNESQSSSLVPVVDCLGFYGKQCGGPLPKTRWTQRTSWQYHDFEVSYLWRHSGSTSVQPVQTAATFPQFQTISSYDYVDLYASWTLMKTLRVSAGVTNVLGKDPPVVGNTISTTAANGGNTFPSAFDVLGRTYTVGLNMHF